MKAIPFDNPSAQRVYNDYIQRCRRVTAILSAKDREEVLLEINSHIYEYLCATRTFNPKHLIQALALNLTNVVIYIIISALFLFEITFPTLIILKLIYPH